MPRFQPAVCEDNLIGRLDYNLSNGAKAFYRYSYFKNSLVRDLWTWFFRLRQRTVTRNHVVGFDFSSGSFTHSIRFSYLKFQNQIVGCDFGTIPLFHFAERTGNQFGIVLHGPNLLAPQSTPQSNHEIKYDGSKIYARAHVPLRRRVQPHSGRRIC